MRGWAATVGGGLALGLAFPRPDLHLLAWVALVPLLLAARRESAMGAWWHGVAFGFAFRLVSLYWLVGTMTRHGGLAWPVAAAAAALLMLYLATYQGLFALVVQRFRYDALSGALVVAATWIGLEYLQSWLFTGFPWGLLGYAGGATSLLAQGADIAGVYGLGLVVVVVNLALAAEVVRAGDRHRLHALAAGLLVTSSLYGGWRLAAATAPPADATLGVATVQGNVPQDRKWDAASRDAVVQRHLELSASAVDPETDLLVWPESSWPDPYGLERDPVAARRLGDLAARHDTALLVGTLHLEEVDVGRRFEVANAALLMDPAGAIAGRYDKVHLVPFGEYLPLRGLLGWLGPIVQAVGTLRPGAADQPLLSVPGRVPAFGVAICYEIAFPSLVRERVAAGATFLVTITNDAWFGRSSGPHQHFAMARLRSIESRRWLVRAANTGISGVIDPWGRAVARSDLEVEATLAAKIEPRTGTTLYTRTGDLLAGSCLIVAVLALAGALVPGRFALLAPPSTVGND